MAVPTRRAILAALANQPFDPKRFLQKCDSIDLLVGIVRRSDGSEYFCRERVSENMRYMAALYRWLYRDPANEQALLDYIDETGDHRFSLPMAA